MRSPAASRHVDAMDKARHNSALRYVSIVTPAPVRVGGGRLRAWLKEEFQLSGRFHRVVHGAHSTPGPERVHRRLVR